MPFYSVWTECLPLGAARAHVRSARAGPRPERERAQCSAIALPAQATTRSEREGWHVGARACHRRNGGLPLVQCPFIVYRPTVPGLARRARTSEAPVLGLVLREIERSGAQAHYPRKPPRAVTSSAGTWEHGPGAERTAASRSCSAPLRCTDRASPSGDRRFFCARPLLPRASPPSHCAWRLKRVARLRSSALALSGDEVLHGRFRRARALRSAEGT